MSLQETWQHDNLTFVINASC